VLKVRPFLKWLGGKYRVVERIAGVLPQGTTLVEPFVGAGAVFLNTDYENYILNDANNDLIALYKILQTDSIEFINNAKKLFNKKYNTETQYYKLRAKFNASNDDFERALIFLYLNRHGYNGLCRYNQNKIFNVPFGRYSAPYFPRTELQFFSDKIQRAILCSGDFQEMFANVQDGWVIYCDPPYVPLSETSNFTKYHSNGFSLVEQKKLAELAEKAACCGVPTLISNHYNDFTKKLYRKAKVNIFECLRSVSCNVDGRKPVTEVLALYDCGKRKLKYATK
jgi:DNA adenine methylase